MVRLVLGVICAAGMPFAVWAQLAHMEVEPDTAVTVGQEVYFTAGRSATNTDVLNDDFFWDFGDGHTLKWDEPATQAHRSGLVCSHYYVVPGTYTVTLTVVDSEGDVDSTKKTVTVSGTTVKVGPRVARRPVLEMKFEDNLDDTSPNGLTAAFSGGTATYVTGREGKAIDVSGSRTVVVQDPEGKLGGFGAFTMSMWVKRNPGPGMTGSVRLFEKQNAYYMKYENGYRPRPNIYTPSANNSTFDVHGDVRVSKQWIQIAVTYDGDTLRYYADGVPFYSGYGNGYPLSGTVASNNNSLIIGGGTRDEPWDGLIDEVKFFDVALSLDEIFEEFESRHAPFQARRAQYLTWVIPGEVGADASNRLYVTLTGDNAHNEVLLDRTALDAQETFLLSNMNLPAGYYTLTSELRDGTGAVTDRIVEYFNKPYDGAPRVGIDENNALYKNGEPFYFVRALGVDERWIGWWTAGDYVNAFITEGWNADHTIASYGEHLDRAAEYDAVYIGPGAYWTDREQGLVDATLERNSNPDHMKEYFTAYKDHEGALGWFFDDEPNLDGGEYRVHPEVLRGWSYVMNDECPQQLSCVSYAGSGYYRDPITDGSKTMINRNRYYSYRFNESRFGGKKTHLTDLIWWDAYPNEQGDMAPGGNIYTHWAKAMDRVRYQNYDLVPIINCMELQQINDDDLDPPTAPEIRMMTWLNVVHNQKGVAYFQYFQPTPTENMAVAREFKRDMDVLAPVVLGAESVVYVGDDANALGRRVDVTVREDSTHVWIFAVRLTERRETDDINVRFNVHGLFNGSEVVMPAPFVQTVYDTFAANGGRTYAVTLNDGNPIQPGSIQLVGGYAAARLSDRRWVWDDGEGGLFTMLEGNRRFDAGTVDYTTGAVSVDFQLPVVAGGANLVAAYAPDTGDRTVGTVASGSFTETFEPYGVRVFRVAKPDGIDTVSVRDRTPGSGSVPVLHPNPTSGSFVVPGMADGTVTLHDLAGTAAVTVDVRDGRAAWNRTAPDLAGGIYVVTAENDTVLGRVMVVGR